MICDKSNELKKSNLLSVDFVLLSRELRSHFAGDHLLFRCDGVRGHRDGGRCLRQFLLFLPLVLLFLFLLLLALRLLRRRELFELVQSPG